MSIEKDLKQSKPFADDYQRAMVNLLYTSRYAEASLQQFHKRQGLTIKQFNILRILRGAARPLSTQVIRQRMIDHMSDISRIVDRMVAKGLVAKCVNANDKRLVDISLTKSGHSLVTAVSKKLENKVHVLSHLTPSDAKQLNHLLDKVRGH